MQLDAASVRERIVTFSVRGGETLLGPSDPLAESRALSRMAEISSGGSLAAGKHDPVVRGGIER